MSKTVIPEGPPQHVPKRLNPDDTTAETTANTSVLVVGTYRGTSALVECREHLAELTSLLETHGSNVVEQIEAPLRRIHPATLLAKGKLEEICTRATELDCRCIVFDEELTPPQQRNLEAYFKLPVADRTEIILRVFEGRAETKEARLQVELAKTQYQAPRLIKLWSHLSRQRGGGINQKGEGEAQLEIDRRILKNRVQTLTKQLRAVERGRKLQHARRARTEIPEIAIIGYTNAGKSTLMNHLTKAGVFVEDKLFATLDTTTRHLILPNGQKVLLTDTVGFLRKLPHQLVAAFRSTLEQSLNADLLVHLVDASHPCAAQHIAATVDVLKSLNAMHKPRIIALNKVDRIDEEALFRLKVQSGASVTLSALDGRGVEQLLSQIITHVSWESRTACLKLPPNAFGRIHELRELGADIKVVFCEGAAYVWGKVPKRSLGTLCAFEIEQEQIPPSIWEELSSSSRESFE